MTEKEARRFAQNWVQAWNSHDIDSILTFYAPEVVLISPLVAKILQNPSCTVSGRDALRRYFSLGLELNPNLSFALLDALYGVSSLLVYFATEKGDRCGEFMELNSETKIVRVVATKASQPLANQSNDYR